MSQGFLLQSHSCLDDWVVFLASCLFSLRSLGSCPRLLLPSLVKGKQQHRAGKNQDSGVVSLAFGHEAASDATWRLGGDTQSSCVVL